MKRIVQCVPNFSEGRRKEVVDAIASEIRSANVRLLDVEMDADHNRSVMTMVGEPENVKTAVLKAAGKAVELIDMEKHKGEHPRVGALDVVPFIPIKNVTAEECVALANEVGKELAERYGIPVFLYEDAATRPERKNLAKVRKGQYEGLKTEIETNPEKKPDYGPSKMHSSAGATVVGARMPLIAYNVNLDTSDLDIAKGIAKKVREKGGGLKNVKAMGFDIKERGIVQVSMNLTNYTITNIWKAFEEVKREAETLGVRVLGSEIVGTVPLDALVGCANEYLKLENFKFEQILETQLWED
jgi:glutamate formiminotransferase